MKLIPLTQGKFTMVDDEDFEFLNQWKWYYHSDGYAVRAIVVNERRASQFMHRVILQTAPGMHTDHINGDRLNNQRSNIRIATHGENQRNLRKRSDNTSGFKGVGFSKFAKKWKSSISINCKQHHLGYFSTPELAYAAYCEASLKYHGEFGRVA